MKILFSATIIAALLLASGVHAATWTVDQAQSQLGFTGSQTGTPFNGQFKHFDAQIDFNPDNLPNAHVVVNIDVASAITGDKQRDEAIPHAEWFDAAKFPQARFEASSFRSLGADRYEAAGTLAIRGIKKDVTLPFTLNIDGDTATMDGKLSLMRTDFGVGQGAWSSGQWVGLNVDVTVHLVATKPR